MPAETPGSYRVLLPGGMYLRIYPDGMIKVAGRDRTITIAKPPNDGPTDKGTSVFLRVKRNDPNPRPAIPGPGDLVVPDPPPDPNRQRPGP